MDGQVAEDVKSERLARLQAAINRKPPPSMRAAVGLTFDVLMEKPGRLPGQLTGRSPYLQPVQVDGAEGLIGTMVPVTITDDRNQQPVRRARGPPRIDAQSLAHGAGA